MSPNRSCRLPHFDVTTRGCGGGRRSRRATAFAPAAFLFATVATAWTAAAVPAPLPTPLSDIPIYSANNVPANLMLALSVEYPTGVVAAYTDAKIPLVYNDAAGNPQTLACNGWSDAGYGVCYFPAMKYLGYFDYDKCYDYDVTNRYFKPVGVSTSHDCAGHWSGNMLNWATMSALDEFRQVLTGGYRSTDTSGLTVLERARDTGQGGRPSPPVKQLDASLNVAPASVVGDPMWRGAGTLYLRSNDSDREFTACDDPGAAASCSLQERGIFFQVADNPCFDNNAKDKTCPNAKANHMRQYYARVQVCVDGMLEKNCNAAHAASDYPGAGVYNKPEGLIQQNYERIRVGAAAYEHLAGTPQPNGSIRAPLRDNGPTAYKGLGPRVRNAATEWDPRTGVFALNPDPADVAASSKTVTGTLSKSGAINYLNQFGHVEQAYEYSDTLSELYYVALAYLKNHPLEAPYFANLPVNATEADGFPVLLSGWDDPIQFTCQGNAIVTIGDAHTWPDTSVPGSGLSFVDNHEDLHHPALPPLAAKGSDPGLDTKLWLTALGNLPLVETNPAVTMNSASDSDIGTATVPGGSSYNIAGMAYYAHTQNIRPDRIDARSSDKITVDTYTVDVMEPGYYDGSENSPTFDPRGPNQYWLAAKYGGFTVDDTQCLGSTISSVPCTTIGGVKVPTPESVLSWHTNATTVAARDLRPDNYFPANRPDLIQSGLSTIFTQVTSKRTLSASAPGVSSSRVLAFASAAFDAPRDGVPVYQTTYYPGVWSGNVLGMLDSVDPRDGSLTVLAAWSAQAMVDRFSTPVTTAPAVPRPWRTARRVVTYDPAARRGIPFRFANLPVAQKSAYPTDLVDYLRGDHTNEGSKFRVRTHVLGDIVGSGAVLVQGALSANYSESANPGYTAFAASVAARRPLVFAGANDGMLHAFAGGFLTKPGTTNPFADYAGRPLGGSEQYAYVPSFALAGPSGTPTLDGLAALANLNGVTTHVFAHHFYVDATPQVADVDFDWSCSMSGVACKRGSRPDWHTLLVGGVGKGGKGIYALDITTPPAPVDMSTSAPQENAIASDVLWEFTDPDLGYTFSRPVVAKTRKYGWVVLLTSGYDNTGLGYLYVLSAHSGTLLEKLATTAGTAAQPSGLGSPTPFTTDNADGTVEQVYAGDLLGNVWRFDLSGTDTYPAPQNFALLADKQGAGQPITTAPRIEVDIDASGLGTRRWVFVGTGRFLDVSDLTSAQPQTMYALRDGSAEADRTDGLPLTRADLLADTDLSVGITLTDKDGGWFYDLTNVAPGGATERIVVDPDAVSGLPIVAWASLVPKSDPCQYGGQQYAVNFGTGRTALRDANGRSLPYLAFAQALASSEIVRLPGSDGAPARYAILGQPLDGPPVLSLLDAVGPPGSLGRANWREVLN